MDVLIVILALSFASLAHSLAVEYNHDNIAEHAFDDNAEWERFKTKYSKKYNSSEEEEKRKMIFKDALKKIHEHNSKFKSGEVSNLQGINQFSDMIADEVPKGLTSAFQSYVASRVYGFSQPTPKVQLPKEVDWRTKGVVTDVKFQGYSCLSDWAFSTTGALEGQLAIKSKKLVSLSEQYLVDCDTNNQGCFPGGEPWGAFLYISEHGIVSEESYPYEAKKGKCRANETDVVTTDKGWNQVKNNEEDLKIAVATVGPIAVSIHATDDFRHYAKYVYTSSECSTDSTRADHAVLIVGYGTTEKGEDYWLVKNSWGKDWGEEGYIRMARNHNNMCGIAYFAIYPIL